MRWRAASWPAWWPVALLIFLSLPLSLFWIGLILAGSAAQDWRIYAEAAERVHSGGLYAITDTYAFPYSPLLAYLLGPVVALGRDAWRIAQLLAVGALPSWPMRILAFVSWPFWFDLQHGALTTFTLLAAAWALRGSRVGQVAYLVLCLLVPRPLYLPVMIWLLWRDPWTRVPFLALLVANAIGVALSGWGPEWLAMLLASIDQMNSFWNLGPSRLIGWFWVPVGFVLAGWLTLRGRLGLASLAAAPYVLPYYLLFALLEIGTSIRRRGLSSRPSATPDR